MPAADVCGRLKQERNSRKHGGGIWGILQQAWRPGNSEGNFITFREMGSGDCCPFPLYQEKGGQHEQTYNQ